MRYIIYGVNILLGHLLCHHDLCSCIDTCVPLKISQQSLQGQIIQCFGIINLSILFTSLAFLFQLVHVYMENRALLIVLNEYQSSYQDLQKAANRPTFLRNIFTFQEQPYELRGGGGGVIHTIVSTTAFEVNSFRYEGTRILSE